MDRTTIEYQGRAFTVEATGDYREPYRLVGKRGSTLGLVRHADSASLFYVRTSKGKLDGGFVGLLDDGRLIWLPSSGKHAAAAQRLYRARRAA